MQNMKIGLLKEGKIPYDSRVALTPNQAAKLKEKFPGIDIVCQTSPIRSYKDQEYADNGIDVVEDVSDCDLLLGIKEVSIDELVSNKTYCFFSHTVKEQPYNRNLLQQIIEKEIRLIDYERIEDEYGKRIIAFGRYAGIVGAYNAIYTYGQKFGLFHLKRAKDCYEYNEVKQEYSKVALPPIKIALTGGGRVANGAIEVLDEMTVRRVNPQEILEKDFDEPVYCQLATEDLYQHKENKDFNLNHFFKFPDQYVSTFDRFNSKLDILISGIYWDPRAPVLFTLKDMIQPEFKIKVVADITCDIEGSIPSTKKASSLDEPVYDFNPRKNKVEPPFSSIENVSVMAIDNLPSELPRDSSEDFGQIMLEKIIPAIIAEDEAPMITKATITKDGHLQAPYQYLHNYVYGN
jgi:saccharopine dehydrogenase (NAD+, L-lysine forming)